MEIKSKMKSKLGLFYDSTGIWPPLTEETGTQDVLIHTGSSGEYVIFRERPESNFYGLGFGI